MDTTNAYSLRPLSIGEIFDRAVTIYVRHFVAFTLIVLTLLAPISVLEYFVLPDQSASLAQAVGQIEKPSKAPAAPFSNAQLAGLAAIVAIALILAPFVNNAVAVGVARIYNGKQPSYGASFATVFKRWLPLLGTAVLNVMILAGLYFATILAFILLLTVGFLLVKSALPIAIAIFIVSIVALLGVLLVFLLLLIAYAFAMYSTSLENASPTHAIGLAYRRLFNKSEIKKATLMALAYIGLEFGVLTLSSMVGLFFVLIVKSYALQLAVNSVVSAMLSAFLTILLAVYYYDIRTRAEGLDLETDLQRLAPSPA